MLGVTAFLLADHAGSLAAHEEAIALVELQGRRPGGDDRGPSDPRARPRSAGRVLEATGKVAEALASYRRACDWPQRWPPSTPKSPTTAATWP